MQANAETFERHLIAGGELLRDSKIDAACREFEAALAVKPDDPKALGLLGLANFRRSNFDEALPVYEKLVDLSPNDASFRLNLGLVHLKLGDASKAIVELSASRKLDPGQNRTVSYLGLALARGGEYARAFEAFLQAGESDLAHEMEQHLSDEEKQAIIDRVRMAKASGESKNNIAVAEVSAAVAEAESDAEADADVETDAGEDSSDGDSFDEIDAGELDEILDEKMDALEDGEPLPDDDGEAEAQAEPEPDTVVVDPEDIADQSDEVVAEPDEVVTEPEQVVAKQVVAEPAVPSKTSRSEVSRIIKMAAVSNAAERDAARTAVGHTPPVALSAYATDRLVRPEDGDHTFEISGDGLLIVRCEGHVMSRTSGVVVSGGDLAYEPVERRVRARNTGEIFGGDQPLFEVSGVGYLVASPGEGEFAALAMDDDILYLRESLVFAFEEGVSWESGHVPGSDGAINVVQFRGDGAVAIHSDEPLVSVKLGGERVLYVDQDVLAGWIGRVIPRLVQPVAGGAQSTPFVECSGEGIVLLGPERGNRSVAG
ncbi:MAG: tetratricopeptide repeat protein [Deltaproteobacteria bacterium]|nr:tetratricopeptide repeat protein [Deltaproteobacteria bacterium]